MRLHAIAIALALCVAQGHDALAACQIKMFAEFPLEPSPDRALIKGAVGGHPAMFIADTGAYSTAITAASAARFGGGSDTRSGYGGEGIGGDVREAAEHFDLTLGNITLKNQVVMVMNTHEMGGGDALIGREILADHDYELDLPDHAIRLLKPEGCAPAQLVYWNKPYSQVPIDFDGSRWPAILINVVLNSHVVPAMVDSGAPASLVSPAAAAVGGVLLSTARDGGRIGGIGARDLAVRIAHFDTIAIGDETIRNTRLRIADLWRYNQVQETGSRLTSSDAPRLILGADFLKAHRVFVANSQRLLLFSYIGGPVFDVPEEAAPARAANAAH